MGFERIGFDRWVEREHLRPLSTGPGSMPPTSYPSSPSGPALISLQLAFGVFGPNPVSDLIQGIIAYLPNLFAAVVILVIVAALAKVVTDPLAAALEVSAASGSRVWQEWPSSSSGSSRPESAADRAGDRQRSLHALLAIVVGVAIVAFGGGGIQTRVGIGNVGVSAQTRKRRRSDEVLPGTRANAPAKS